MLGEHVGDALQVRLDGVAEILGVVVAGGRAHVVEVDLQRHRLHADRHEPVLPDEIEQRHLVGDVLEVAAEVLLVAAVGRRGDAEHEGVFVEIAERVEVAVRERVMRFVHDDEAEVIARPPFAPRRAHERLHARDDDRRVAGSRGSPPSRPRRMSPVTARILSTAWRDEFLAVREHERPPRLMRGREMREHDGLAAAGREHEQLALILREPALDRLVRRDLVAAQGDA